VAFTSIGLFFDLPDRREARKRQKEAELVGKSGICAGDRHAGLEVFGL
jgi:hypothetical protein